MKNSIDDTWISKDGIEIPIKDMTNEYLKSIHYFYARLYDQNKCNGIPKAIELEMIRRGFI